MAFQRREEKMGYDEESREYDGESRPEDIDTAGQVRIPGEQKERLVRPGGEQATPLGGRTGTAVPPGAGRHEEGPVSLVPSEEAAGFREKWNTIQTRFVDEPRGSVEEADTLVADVMRRLTELFANERSGLERQWSRGDNVSTEDLRLAMQRYRSFFDRLLSH